MKISEKRVGELLIVFYLKSLENKIEKALPSSDELVELSEDGSVDYLVSRLAMSITDEFINFAVDYIKRWEE